VISTTHDFSRYGFALNCYIADPVEWIALFKMPDAGPPGLWRVVVPVPDQAEDVVLAPGNVEDKMQRFVARSVPYEVRYKSTYRVHQRVCKTFRSGRVLLAGDAAHINNPIGAFGLNSGIHDAVNLAEKLGRVWRGDADEALLDLYARQRRTVAIEQVDKMSIRNKRLLEEHDPEVQREHLLELVAVASNPERARRHMLETTMIAALRQAERVQ
jgi:3-(3-hydroxy-phenyl)propionate hydroxylase